MSEDILAQSLTWFLSCSICLKGHCHQSFGRDSHTEVEFTNFLGSRVYLGFLKSRLESRFQEVVIHQFRAKNAT
jgi:hypothetical protein